MVVPVLGEAARARVEETVHWWREWAGRCRYQGPYRGAVVRSALVLKLLAFAPSGALVAAPTTSLPERPGGDSNWDYRFCWLRDAAFTVRCLFGLGYATEAEAFLDWLLHATRLTRPELQVVYDVYGEARLPERELTHLTGYAGSRPVRTGNDAYRQFQLDVYGEVADAAASYAAHGGRFDREAVRMLNGLGRTVCARWREPDAGIWESRGPHAHYTHSKVLCWVALDRLVRLHEEHGLALDAGRFRAERDAIRAEVETRGFNLRLGSYTRRFDGDDLDASLLLLPLYGYVDASHPRMRGTTDRVLAALGRGPLVYRYPATDDDGRPTGEGTFGACAFWAVECRARGGDLPGARDAFDRLLAYANDLGLFAEEIAPDSGAALGNFPQAFTHIGLIDAALALAECAAGRADREKGSQS
jgi:GH15 family glucan-1,4-alpha-glucosidase